MRRVAPLVASFLLAAAPLGAQDATTYLPRLEDVSAEALGLLEELESGSLEQRMATLDALCRLAVQRDVGNALVELPSGTLRGLRALLRDRARALDPEERAAFRAFQEQLAPALVQQGAAALLARSPAADSAAASWQARLEAALEQGDVAGAAAWLEAAGDWGHTLHGDGALVSAAWTEAHARGELAQIGSHVPPAWAKLAARWGTPPVRVSVPRREPQLLANVRVPGGDWETSSPSVPMLTPRRVLVSTGSSVLRYSRKGTLLSRFPQRADGAAPPPAEATRIRAQLTRFGQEVFTPLALERWLTPAREPEQGSQRTDPALGGYFYSLVGLDVDSLRVAWWDGDPGPRAAPSPLSGDPRVELTLRSGHVIACASDGSRIYVALLTKGTELSLYLFAYRPVSRIGQGASLEPAWPAPVRIVQVERHGGSEDQAVRPELATRLTLDGCGRLVCTTDVGIVACLSAVSGDLQWVHERFAKGSETEFRRGGPRPELEVPLPPAAALTVPDPQRPELGPIAIAYAGPELLGVRLRTGRVVWTRPRIKLEHLLPGEEAEFLAYGQNQAYGLNSLTGKPIHPQGRPLSLGRFHFCGLGVQVEGGYLIPVRLSGRGSGNVSLHRLAWRKLPAGGRSILFDGSHKLPLNQPANLAIDEEHVVVLGSNRLQVLSFDPE